MQEVEVNLVDTNLMLYQEYGIEFSVCPVSGHNQHGQVERKIRSIQDSMAEVGFENMRLHATGLQTLLKLIENQLNNLPIGYTYGRDQDNNPLLKMLTPNMMRVGRSNHRALDGPMRMPQGDGELLKEVEKIYKAWFKVWNISYVPKLLAQPKWFQQDQDLLEGDVVMFQKSESDLGSRWTLGTVDQLVKSKDGLARRAIVRYKNFKEEFHRVTDRSVRSLVKIWSCDDLNIDDDLAELHRRLCSIDRGEELVKQIQTDDTQAPVLSDDEQPEPPCKALVSLLAVTSVEQGSDLPPPLYDDEEVPEGVEAGCVCSVTGILQNLNFNLE